MTLDKKLSGFGRVVSRARNTEYALVSARNAADDFRAAMEKAQVLLRQTAAAPGAERNGLMDKHASTVRNAEREMRIAEDKAREAAREMQDISRLVAGLRSR